VPCPFSVSIAFAGKDLAIAPLDAALRGGRDKHEYAIATACRPTRFRRLRRATIMVFDKLIRLNLARRFSREFAKDMRAARIVA
jgi:hypothetical protein